MSKFGFENSVTLILKGKVDDGIAMIGYEDNVVVMIKG